MITIYFLSQKRQAGSRSSCLSNTFSTLFGCLSWNNNLSRTFFCTNTTVCTFVCINMSQTVQHSDRTGFTASLTKLTSDTAHFADAHQCLSLIMGAALHECLLLIWNQLDQLFRTGFDAFSTCFTCFFVYNRNPVLHVNGIKRTGLHTASESKTSIRTSFLSSVLHQIRHHAVFNSVIFIYI